MKNGKENPTQTASGIDPSGCLQHHNKKDSETVSRLRRKNKTKQNKSILKSQPLPGAQVEKLVVSVILSSDLGVLGF